MKIRKIISEIICIYLLVISANYIYGQKQYNDTTMTFMAIYDDLWAEINPPSRLESNELIRKFHVSIDIDSELEFVFDSEIVDLPGFLHKRYIQQYKDYVIEGAGLTIHYKDEHAELLNGKILKYIPYHNNLVISQNYAFYIASNEFIKYGVSAENKSELVFTKSDTSKFSEENFYLCYRFSEEWISVYINAETGELFKVREDIHNASTGTASTIYNEEQYINTEWTGWALWNRYILRDDSRGGVIHTVKATGNDYHDYDNYWDASNAPEKAAYSAHWATEKAFDYFYNVFTRNGMEGNGSIELHVYVDQTIMSGMLDLETSYLPPARLNFPQDDLTDDYLVNLESVGHEFTHGVSHFIYNPPVSSNEIGAIDEGVSDVFGNMIQYYIEGNGNDWTFGEYWAGTVICRYFIQPSLDGHASDSYNDANWQNSASTSYDKAGVIRRWFYLLSMGDPTLNITGTTREIAAMILYHALFFLNSYSQIADLRVATIKAAMDFYGDCSMEIQQTIKAWDAVNVSSSYACPNLYVDCADLTSHHNNDESYFVHGLDYLYSNCNIQDNNITYFTAHNKIHLTDGFRSGTGFFTYFHAWITECSFGTKNMFADNYDAQYYNNDFKEENNYDVKSINSKNIAVFPNPTSGIFTVSCSDNSLTFSAEVTDFLSRTVLTGESKNGSVQFDLSSKPKGIYFVKLVVSGAEPAKTSEGKTYVGKIIEQ